MSKNKFTCLKMFFWLYLDKEITMPMKALIFLAFANDLSRSLDTNSEHDLISQELKDIPQVQRLTVSKESLETVFRENSNSLQVFHFGGHGRKNALYLAEYQNNDLVGDFFVNLLSKYPIKLAVLNACNSHEIAKKLSEKGISAIGTVGVIEDEKTLRFAQSFYGHLAQGNTLQEAFERAKTASQAQQWQLFATEKGKNWKLEHYYPPHIFNQNRNFAEEFYRISSASFNQIQSFFTKNNQHLDRQETQKLLEWIEKDTPQNQKPIHFLLGEAGIGKSVIMKDVWESLKAQQIPCLALKADQEADFFSDDKRSDLYYQLQSVDKVVVLIDQIDALSLSLSADRSNLGNYQKFIAQIIELPNVRIVVSCREYDFKYDSAFSTYQNKIRTTVEKLPIEQVKNILNSLDKTHDFSKQQIEFLRNPLHLNLYCEVYQKGQEIYTIIALYDKLWEQKLTIEGFDKEKLENLLYEIAQIMGEIPDTKLSFRKYEDNKEIQTLITQGLLSKNENNLQFFHQTFFDYVFARFFVKNGKELTQYLQENHQGLFIRSKVKYVLDYLRDYDRAVYIQQIKEIITQDEYRYHIKLLVIDALANPSQLDSREKSFIKKHILTTEFRDVFFTKIKHEDILNYLYGLGEVKKNLQEEKRDLFNQFTKKNPEKGLTIFMQTHLEGKEKLAYGVIWRLDDFSSDTAKNFIYQYKDFIFEGNKKNSSDFYVLEKIISTNPSLASTLAFEFFQQKIESEKKIIDLYEGGKHFFETFFSQKPNYAYSLAIQCLDYQHDYLMKTESFFLQYSQEKDLAELLINYLRKETENNFDFVKTEINKFCNSIFPVFLFVAYEIMLEKPELFITELFENITKRNFLYQNSGAVHSRVLENLKIIDIFDKKQQKEIANTIKKLHFEGDKVQKWNGKIYNGIDYSLHRILQCLPSSFLKEFALHLKAQELERRLGKFVNKKESFGISSILSGASYTLSTKNPDKISFKEWKKAFLKYTTDKQDENPYKRKPTLTGVSGLFSKQVQENPTRFFSFIKEIIPDTAIPERYKIDALEALKEAKFDAKRFKEVYLLALPILKEDYPVRQLVSQSVYLTQHQIYEEQVFNFLEKTALDYPIREYTQNENSIDLGQHALMNGINSAKGAAARHLIYFAEKYADRIFDIYEKLLSEKSTPLRVCIIQNLHYLNQYDKQRSLTIFLKLLENKDEALIEVGGTALSYMMQINFEVFIPFFEQNIYSSNTKIIEIFAYRLVEAYLFGKHPKAEELLEKFLAYSPLALNKAIWAIFKLLEKNNKVEVADKCKTLLYKYLDSEDKELGKSYEHGFAWLKAADFNYFIDWLETYVDSKIGQYRNYNFYEYLLKSIPYNAVKCYELGAKIVHLEAEDILQHTKEDLNFIIKVYNALKEEGNLEIKEKIMDTFDDMLKVKSTHELENILEKSMG